MEQEIYTINGVDHTRKELLEFGKKHYPKFHWIKRGIGLGIISACLLVFLMFVTIFLFFSPTGAREGMKAILPMGITLFILSLPGIILFILSFVPLPDEKYIILAKNYYEKQNKQ